MHPEHETLRHASPRRRSRTLHPTVWRRLCHVLATAPLAFLLAGVFWSGRLLRAQDAAAGPGETTLPLVSGVVGLSTRELGQAVTSLKISKWKAPGPVKDDAQSNAASITRDLDSTLPTLLAQSDAAPGSIASAFAVYRNLDALYEVLLRVSGTADLAAPDDEAASLTHALGTLEGTRRSLADSILTVSHAQETALAQRRAAPVAPPPAAPPATTTVVSDGPATSATAHRKSKPKASATAPVKAPQN